jgi:predicted AlkP superfamily phosphohydrolase/phosphomutase
MNDMNSTLEDRGLVLPDYQNSNLSEVKKFSTSKSSKKLLLIVDGLGMLMVEKVLGNNPDLKKSMEVAEIKKVKTLFPSTTPAILTSFDSGMSIAEHGIVGEFLPVKNSAL